MTARLPREIRWERWLLTRVQRFVQAWGLELARTEWAWSRDDRAPEP